MRNKIIGTAVLVVALVAGLFAMTSAQADTPTPRNKIPGSKVVSAKAIFGLPASASDVAKVRPHIARFMAKPGDAQVVRGHGEAVLEGLFGTEAVAGPQGAVLKAHDLLVTVAKGDVTTDMVPVAPGAKIGPFRSVVTVTDANTGRLVTVLFVAVNDPPAKDDLARFNVAPSTVTVSSALRASVHAHG